MVALAASECRRDRHPPRFNSQPEMSMKKTLFAAALMLAVGTAFANNCPNVMKDIDAKLATNPKLSEADMAKVKQLRTEGETAHKAGKHDDSMKALGEAKKLLGI
jgi:hypothetical protein